MNWLENVKNIKKKRGLTNESLSAQSEISLGTLNKLLSGATADPKLSTLLALAKGLDCSVDEMLTGVAPQEILSLRLYDIAASAGTGTALDTDVGYSKINVYGNPTTELADFAIRVRGNSMNPKYQDGDVLLVSRADEIERGELGIFMFNGESYFKKFGGDRLISLNPEYSDIVFGGGDDIKCFGRVIGRLKR